MDDQDIMLESIYIVKPESVPASKAKEVEDVFNAIKNLNASVLALKKI